MILRQRQGIIRPTDGYRNHLRDLWKLCRACFFFVFRTWYDSKVVVRLFVGGG